MLSFHVCFLFYGAFPRVAHYCLAALLHTMNTLRLLFGSFVSQNANVSAWNTWSLSCSRVYIDALVRVCTVRYWSSSTMDNGHVNSPAMIAFHSPLVLVDYLEFLVRDTGGLMQYNDRISESNRFGKNSITSWAYHPEGSIRERNKHIWIRTLAPIFLDTSTRTSHLSSYLHWTRCFSMYKAHSSWVSAFSLKRFQSLEIGHAYVTYIPQDSCRLEWWFEYGMGGDVLPRWW